MMNHKKIITTILFCMTAVILYAQAPEAGVPLRLAEERAWQVSDVRYDLTFNIPASRQEPVKGHVAISFIWNGDGDVVLDFQGKRDQFDGNCTIYTRKNARRKKDKRYPSFAAFVNEHIIVPKEFLNPGVRNTVHIDFTSSDKSLNRSEDYLYTLFVPDHARSVFPCFDQPDLKATFKLTLEMPADWKAISNGEEERNDIVASRRTISFAGTERIPTYLFSFTAGMFHTTKAVRDGRELTALYRENAPEKVAQLATVFDEIGLSLRWLEQYTGLKYPFQKYGFVVLPGYQFGGMEHPGAIQYNEKRIFLSQNPTPEEELSRLELIAHETAHMWFGDLVTMKWFNDVWTKEVFANFMAAKIAQQQFPDINHDLNFLKTYQALAMKTDRTEGTHPIQQPLKNLNQAGLLYGNIIYNKAPVMMQKLEEQMGEERFRNGIRNYLRRYAYANATWDDLITILDKEAPEAQLKTFSEAWVKHKGMPVIETTIEGDELVVRQKDPFHRGVIWNQKFNVMLGYDFEPSRIVPIDMKEDIVRVPIDKKPDFLMPNYQGKGYGRFTLDDKYLRVLIKRIICTPEDLNRYALLRLVYENYLMGKTDKTYFSELFRALQRENNPLIATTICNQLYQIAFDQNAASRKTLEPFLLDIIKETQIPSCRQHLIRLLAKGAISKEALDFLYTTWRLQNDPLLNERDYINLSYHLAMMRPKEWKQIIDTQRARLRNEDLIREYDFVSRACTPDIKEQRRLFRSLLQRENRAVEPWALSMLSLLSRNVREPQNNEFITPGLEVLEEIQQTGDIFFPGNWATALLSQHKSREAQQLVKRFLDSHPNYSPTLKNKLLEAAWELMRHN